MTMYRTIRTVQPRVVVVDPVTNLVDVGSTEEVSPMLVRLIDFLKMARSPPCSPA